MLAPLPSRRAQIKRGCKELWYVIGALLGDGYSFNAQKEYLVGLDVRSRNFAEKFAAKESKIFSKSLSRRTTIEAIGYGL